MDGKKNVATLILEAEAERGFDLKEGQVKKVLNALNHLADYGYLDVIERPALTQDDLIAALKQAGITQDDVLLVHASISKCGYIQGIYYHGLVSKSRKCNDGNGGVTVWEQVAKRKFA